MTKLNTFAGIDVSKAFFDVWAVRDQKEQCCRLHYNAEGLQALVQWLPQGVHCVMEATGPYYLRLACFLYQQGYAVSVVNPLAVRRFAQMLLRRAKTDRTDARLIAAYAQCQPPGLWQPPASYLVTLQQLGALEGQLTKQHTALLCQQEAFRAGGLMNAEVEGLLQGFIEAIGAQLREVQKRIQELVTAHHHQLLQNVLTIPGIGKKTAVMLIVLTEGFKKFTTHKQLSAYIGLCPRIYESGSSVRGRGAICKMGTSRVRALLYVCAWSAARCNQECRELYERLLQRGKAKKLALIAVANKLIRQAFAIATKKVTYQPHYANNIWP